MGGMGGPGAQQWGAPQAQPGYPMAGGPAAQQWGAPQPGYPGAAVQPYAQPAAAVQHYGQPAAAVQAATQPQAAMAAQHGQPVVQQQPGIAQQAAAVPQPGAAAAQPALPAGWSTALDPNSGRTYYINNHALTSQWEVPTAPAQPKAA